MFCLRARSVRHKFALMTCFIHAADIHLGAPMSGLAHRSKAAADVLADATIRSFEALIDATLDAGAAFLIVAGDLFDRDVRDLKLQIVAARGFARLTRAGVRVFLLAGNHDAVSQAAMAAEWPEGVQMFGSAEATRFDLPELGVALAGRSYGAKAEARNIAAEYPPPEHGRFNIGVLHTSCDGRAGHGAYAPCAPADLVARGYDYWALGHVHSREVVRRDPWIVYPGCLQGRSIRETGAKGALKVTLRDGRVATAEPITLDTARWAAASVDLSEATRDADIDEAIDRALADAADGAEGRPVVARLTLTGRTALHAALNRADALATWRGVADENAEALSGALPAPVFLEKLVIATAPAAEASSAGLDDVFDACLDEARSLEEVQAEIRDALKRIDTQAGGSLGLDAAEAQLERALALIRAEAAALPGEPARREAKAREEAGGDADRDAD